MSDYKYDYLLADQFEKAAFLGMAGIGARAAPMLARAGTAIGQAARGLGGHVMQFGRNLGNAFKTEGAKGFLGNMGRGFVGMGARGGAESAAHGLGTGLMAANTAYSVGSAFMPPKTTTASLREKQGHYTFKGAEGSLGQKVLHTAPYAAWIASNLLDKDKHPILKPALNLGAYGLYAGMAGHEALTDPKERYTSGTDALALSAMALADIARMRRDSQNP